jgi:hypothetical protein
MDDAERERRIERRRQVVRLIKAMHASENDTADSLVASLAADDDRQRVIGALAVAGSTLVESLSKVANRTADDVLDGLEKALTSAPVEG